MPEAKRKLKKIRFDFEGAEVSYTDASQGGACSMKNEPYLLKAKKMEPLTEEQSEILKLIGEEPTPLGKNKGKVNKSSTKDTEVEKNKLNKGNEMSVSREEFESLQKALKVAEASNDIHKYAFEDELKKSVANSVASLSESEKQAILKAFDFLVEEKEKAVTKAKETSKEESENPLAKKLEKEAGHEGEQEEEVEKSVLQRALEIQKASKNGESK